MGVALGLLDRIVQFVINPTILLIFSFGFLLFIYGMVEFLAKPEAGLSDKSKGKQHMIWGIVGMFVMIAAGGFIDIIIGTFGLEIPAQGSGAPRSGGGGTLGFPQVKGP
ncbi:MAG: hypothetical protein AAB421_02505 [Patescibacteria group bacterium]